MSPLQRLCCAALLLSLPACFAQSAPSADPTASPAYTADPKFQAALKDAKTLRGNGVAFQADAYKKANKIAGGQCMECLQGMYKAQMATREYKDANTSAMAMAALATKPMEKSYALYQRALGMQAQAGEKPKPAQLAAVHAMLQESITDYPKNVSARFVDGKVLAQMGMMDEAKAQFTECVHCVSPHDPARLRATHFAENPTLALQKMAPAFEVTALDGSKFNLDAMGGRVVLIDFWATWCGPCNEELPQVKKIAKDFAGQPLVIISVSWDSDPEKWKAFINKNEMTWVQYRDSDHALSNAFGINAIPHYFTIDSDGVLTAEMIGSGNDVEGRLKKLVNRARESHATMASTAAEAGKGAPGLGQ